MLARRSQCLLKQSKKLPKVQSVKLSSKPYYVTTPIFYVNAAPHIGHLHSMVLANALTNYQSYYNERPTLLTTGTDEHGIKVKQAAEKAGMDPKEYVDLASNQFKELADKAHIAYDRFIRTTDADNVEASQHLWNTLVEKGFIYKGEHKGWYCVSDETFYPEDQIEQDPENPGEMRSKETLKKVELSSEENYFFAMSKLREQLLDHYHKNRDFVVPQQFYDNMEREIDINLQDLSISRPTSRNDWGVPVPGDPSQCMYVWVDALTNYLTSTGYPQKTNDTESAWPADVHIVGKDIIRFHSIYWPAFLLAAEIPLPKQIVVHAHWTMGGSKMSKSIGNVVDPFLMLETFSCDSVKYFLLNDSYLDRDSDFSKERVLLRHNSELVNKLGNLLMRICGPKFNIHRALSKDSDKVLKVTPYYDSHRMLKSDIDGLEDRVRQHMKGFKTAQALSEIWVQIAFANRYLQETAPWAIQDEDVRDCIIKDAAEIARICLLLSQPFIPELSGRMLDRLGVDNRSISYAKYDADQTYGFTANRKGDYPITAL